MTRTPASGLDLASMRDEVSTTLAPQRAGATLLSGFAALALLLASVGISGVVAFAVAQRRREFAVRLALGAPVRRIVLLLVRDMGTPVALGMAAGLAAAIALGPTMRALIVGVEPADPLTLVSTVVLLGIAALLATMAPVRRAARTDPMEAMRAD